MSAEPAAAPVRVYWQPGCTSCLRAKEFLAAHGIGFESINVRAVPGALEELAARGIRAVPVIARGTEYVLGQDLDELAAFLGLEVERVRLGLPQLLERLDRLLRVAEATTLALPASHWEALIPQRERSYLDLGYHVAMICEGFLAAARGGELAFEWYERRTPPDRRTAAAVAAAIAGSRRDLACWAAGSTPEAARLLHTYFGERPLHTVLERTAWHVAQHCRQLEHIVTGTLHGAPVERLGAADLAGLPLPEAVWDREISPP